MDSAIVSLEEQTNGILGPSPVTLTHMSLFAPSAFTGCAGSLASLGGPTVFQAWPGTRSRFCGMDIKAIVLVSFVAKKEKIGESGQPTHFYFLCSLPVPMAVVRVDYDLNLRMPHLLSENAHSRPSGVAGLHSVTLKCQSSLVTQVTSCAV